MDRIDELVKFGLTIPILMGSTFGGYLLSLSS